MKRKSLLFFALFMGGLTLQAQEKKFVEVSAAAGINHAFKIDLATFGGGACVIDFDNDGFEDLYVTGGVNPDVLYRNNGDGTFTDIHKTAGFERTYMTYTQGVTAADVNRDGYKDLLITTMNFLDNRRTISPNLLYLNNGDGTFKEVTQAWGLENYRVNSMSATFGDINADGYPDLYVSNYFSNSTTGISIYNEQTITNSFQPSIDFLFINVGGQKFVDARTFYGLDYVGFGFQGVFTDYDNDGDLDLYVINDFGFKSTTNLMFRNEYPKRKFTNRTLQLALNYGMNAMGIAPADYNFDGYMDYFVTNLGTSLFSVNQQAQGKAFVDRTVQTGLAIPTIYDSLYVGPPVSWGANFFDYDHDMDMDLFVCNGALNPTIRPNPNFFFEFTDGRFEEVAKKMDLFDYRIGRGSVVFDYDNDGDLDLFVVNQIPRDPTPQLLPARCLLYRNDAAKGNWLKVELQGVQADKNGIGSKVEIRVNGKLLIREIDGGSSHISQNSTIAHFGLSDAKEVESITVKWVGGKQQTISKIAANQHIIIKENMDDAESTASKQNQFTVSPTVFTDNVFLTYDLEKESPIQINILDSQGRLVERLANIKNPTSTGVWQWEVNKNLAPGMYIFQIQTAQGVMANKAIKL